MININKVVLVGRLTKDPEIKKTPQNNSVVQFTLAVDRPFAKEGQQQADFISCVAWRQSADYLGQYARKGNPVGVEGRIQTRNYDGPNGKVYVTEVMVDRLSIIVPKVNNQTSPAPQQQPGPEYNSAQYYNNQEPEPEQDGGLMIAEDDLPFY